MLDDQIPGNVTTLVAVFRTTKRAQDIWEEISFILHGIHKLSRIATFHIIEECSRASCTIVKYWWRM
jgi:hypothetical protein